MAGVTITPATIGGPFTNLIAYFPSLTVTSQNGGRISKAGFTGSGASIAVNSYFTDDMSASGLARQLVSDKSFRGSEDRSVEQWFTAVRAGYPGTLGGPAELFC